MSHFIRRALIVGRAFRARNATPTYDADGSRVNSHKRTLRSMLLLVTQQRLWSQAVPPTQARVGSAGPSKDAQALFGV